MKINYSTVANENLASYRYRIKIPSEYLRKWGHEVVIGKPEKADVGVFSKHFNANDAEIARQPTRYREVVFDVCDYHLDGPYREHYERMMALADVITVGTGEMGMMISKYLGHDVTVIQDPYEFEEKEPKHEDCQKVLWFGHASNIAPLIREINNGVLNGKQLMVISNPNEYIPTVPWSMQNMERGFEECDVVIIPQQNTRKNRCKGANRIVESIRSGRFVIANEMPSHEQFKEWMYIGDIQEGLEWCRKNKSEIRDRIAMAQKYVRRTFSPEEISRQWLSALTSGVATKSSMAI
jgi:hypothetical protein